MRNTKQKRELKQWRQARRSALLSLSHGKPPGENLVLYLGGVILRAKGWSEPIYPKRSRA
jgi:hypothetical protein